MNVEKPARFIELEFKPKPIHKRIVELRQNDEERMDGGPEEVTIAMEPLRRHHHNPSGLKPAIPPLGEGNFF